MTTKSDAQAEIARLRGVLKQLFDAGDALAYTDDDFENALHVARCALEQELPTRQQGEKCMTKHTPAPWTVTTHFLGPCVMAKHPDPTNSNTLCIAQVNDVHYGVFYKHVAQADARLIAAAPDLLAALEHLLADARACEMDVGQYSGSLIEARAAIAKVTGA